jgi:predicted TIM-barrel fold metal-dependent hydrolase
MYEEWAGAYPDRLVGIGITWLADPQIGAQEIRRNAERGFTSVTLPEMPHRIGLPSMHTRYWDPILQACEDTDTVISLHVGSSGTNAMAPDAPGGINAVIFPSPPCRPRPTGCGRERRSGFPT